MNLCEVLPWACRHHLPDRRVPQAELEVEGCEAGVVGLFGGAPYLAAVDCLLEQQLLRGGQCQ